MNSGQPERLWKLQTSANSLVLEGKREADSLIDFLQKFVFGPDLGAELWAETHKALGLEVEYQQAVPKLVFPNDQNLWYMPMVLGVTSNKIVAGHRRLGVNFSLCNEDLDIVAPKHDRDANRDGAYIVGFRRNVEADEEFANKSAKCLATIGHKGICLPERLMLGAGYYIATGQHLDVINITLCAGSLHCDDSVLRVYWNPACRKVYVDWCSLGNYGSGLRSRSADFCNIMPA